MMEGLKGERKERCHADIERAIKKLEKSSTTNIDPREAEKLYNILLSDMEDALLAKKPSIRYVSAPTSFRIAFFFLTKLPGQLMDKAIERLVKRSA